MLLNIPYADNESREKAKKLGARWKPDCKCWSLADDTELGELTKFKVEVIYASAAQLVQERANRVIETLEALENDADLGLTLSTRTRELLGKFDEKAGAPNADECKSLARDLAVQILRAGGYTHSDLKSLDLLQR